MHNENDRFEFLLFENLDKGVDCISDITDVFFSYSWIDAEPKGLIHDYVSIYHFSDQSVVNIFVCRVF